MSDGLTLDPSARFTAAASMLLSLTSREAGDEMKIQARGFVVEAYSVLPPATGKGRGVKVKEADEAAKARGDKRIIADLGGIFAPRDLKGSRTITSVFGHPLRSPVTVPTVERYPDVAGIYADRNVRRHGDRLTRGRRQAFYVSRSKFEALAKELQAHVGYGASGLNAAAQALGARIPSYARGKSAPGTIHISVSPTRIVIRLSNDVAYIAQTPDVLRKWQWALDAQAAKIERQLPYIIKKAGLKAGFKAS